ncbi:hypothetical protein GTY81_35120 [Streptomyces sp. SID8366]|uniref:hypothetical protein n=1 Tax=unclassified Streptomyces TaxID=2593676 RepID=UPI000DBA4329|nr:MULTISPECIES: hypothetical protein [unclassified Streptomyces]MYU09010.1 hypothetical protein [Streptomyces sp. SID8366]MYU67968.1 hypothetical protein [Streptomyces sp. SID69]RAJ52520.1 hypothetical protein K376_05976 [Streptomyces sp. PsTaAH-130]
MCPNCGDFYRTVFLLGQLALYADMDGADLDFVDAVTPSLVVSLPEPPPGMLPEDRDPDDGPAHPGDA